MSEEAVRVKQIMVWGLFGMYRHQIRLNADARVTVIHGPNGVGKTAILKMTHNALTGKEDISDGKPFSKFMIHFSGRDFLAIRGHETPEKRPPILPVLMIETERISSIESTQVPLSDGTTYHRTPRLSPVIVKKQQLMQQAITTSLAEYALLSDQLQQSSLERLISGISPLSQQDIQSQLSAIESVRQYYQSIGILSNGQLKPLDLSHYNNLNDAQRSAATLHIQDSKAVLDVIASIASKLHIFTTALNARLLNKKVVISRTKGFQIFTTPGQEVPLDALSSGEQHQIILLFTLLFETQPNTLVLIDEPELSQHISWQKEFMEDMLKIARVAELDILIATHSPYIVGDHPELMVELSGAIS